MATLYDTGNPEHEKWYEDQLLDDIGFSLDQLKEVRVMYKRNVMNQMGKMFEEMIMALKEENQATKTEYEERYGRKPKIDDVNRVFISNRRNLNKTRGKAGTTNNDNPIAKP